MQRKTHSFYNVSIFPLFVLLHAFTPLPLSLSLFLCNEVISRIRMYVVPFSSYGDITLRIRYSIWYAVVDLIEHKGFRYSSNAICNRAIYPIKSSYAVDCATTWRQTIDKFYSTRRLLHTGMVIFIRIVAYHRFYYETTAQKFDTYTFSIRAISNENNKICTIYKKVTQFYMALHRYCCEIICIIFSVIYAENI